VSVQPRMLDHAFYRAWMNGEVPVGTLAAYHRSYHEFISRIPGYWQRVVDAFQPDGTGEHPVVREERLHILLWEKWGRRLTPPESFPRLNSLLDSLDAMTPSGLLGALQAFEVQQPEVARTKKEGLIRHYGFRSEDLTYFDEHQKEEGHIAFGAGLASRFADQAEFTAGIGRGALLCFNSLDSFVTT
jgi:pyrroloquinoline quinone (PQQ) biosynthesis protein C